jgi:hypothetical protein
MSSPKDEEKPHDETRDHGDGDNDEVRQHARGRRPSCGAIAQKSRKSKRGG